MTHDDVPLRKHITIRHVFSSLVIATPALVPNRLAPASIIARASESDLIPPLALTDIFRELLRL